ncbi:MAG: protease modulator HflC [Deltaproteobacteria bacterium]|nr:protease modulator HflC [Deltaproteobacteria bacterium]
MKAGPTILVVVAVLVLLNMAVYSVDQTQQAIVVQLGKPVGDVRGPGLHFMIPFIQQVIFFDKRVLVYDAAPAEILTRDKKNLVVDNFSMWRIVDPLKFFQTVRDINGAQARLDDIVYSQLRVTLGNFDLTELISGVRGKVMDVVTKNSDQIAIGYGVRILDVRVKRADLPAENERHVFGRMEAERHRQAKKYRSEGEEESLKLKADADRERSVIIAEAKRKAEEIMGQGDAEATKVYAQALQQDPEFYAFSRILLSYDKALKSDTTLVLTPDSEYLKYLKSSSAK